MHGLLREIAMMVDKYTPITLDNHLHDSPSRIDVERLIRHVNAVGNTAISISDLSVGMIHPVNITDHQFTREHMISAYISLRSTMMAWTFQS